ERIELHDRRLFELCARLAFTEFEPHPFVPFVQITRALGVARDLDGATSGTRCQNSDGRCEEKKQAKAAHRKSPRCTIDEDRDAYGSGSIYIFTAPPKSRGSRRKCPLNDDSRDFSYSTTVVFLSRTLQCALFSSWAPSPSLERPFSSPARPAAPISTAAKRGMARSFLRMCAKKGCVASRSLHRQRGRAKSRDRQRAGRIDRSQAAQNTRAHPA